MTSFADRYPLHRKFCSKCGRWRHVFDFNVHKWITEGDLRMPGRLQARCKTCNRGQVRVRAGERRRGAPYAPEKSASIAKRRETKLMKKHVPQPEDLLDELDREEGIVPDPEPTLKDVVDIAKKHGLVTSDAPRPDFVPSEPFVNWIRQTCKDDRTAYLLAADADIPTRKMYEIMYVPTEEIRLDTVDRILTAAGSPDVLHELYPLEED